jgi:hypothetical protein
MRITAGCDRSHNRCDLYRTRLIRVQGIMISVQGGVQVLAHSTRRHYRVIVRGRFLCYGKRNFTPS